MQLLNNNTQAFLALARARLWEQDVRLFQFENIDVDELMRLAEEQSIIGLVTAGLERVRGTKVPQDDVLQFVGQTLQVEQQNKEMNVFIAELVDKMRRCGIYTLLVKGQGIAQCYEKPLWRSSEDVDFYFSKSNYKAAIEYLKTLATHVDGEDKKRLYAGMMLDSWTVELHGALHSNFSNRTNKMLDEVHHAIFLWRRSEKLE